MDYALVNNLRISTSDSNSFILSSEYMEYILLHVVRALYIKRIYN